LRDCENPGGVKVRMFPEGVTWGRTAGGYIMVMSWWTGIGGGYIPSVINPPSYAGIRDMIQPEL